MVRRNNNGTIYDTVLDTIFLNAIMKGKKIYMTLGTVVAITMCISKSYAQHFAQPDIIPQISYNSQLLNFYSTKVKQTMYLLSNGYVDTISLGRITESAIIKMMEELDPHSQYISAKDVKQMEEPLLGKFEGIGVEYAIIRDTLTIQSVIPDGPAEKVGLKAGDKINSVDGKVVSNTSLTPLKVINYLRGDKGSKVRLEIIRRGQPAGREVVITRDKIPVNTVTSAYQIGQGIFYIRISGFGLETYNEVMEPLKAYKGEIKGLILDLRGNGGGFLHTALQLANEFLERGQLILYSEGRAVRRTDDYADGRGTLKNVPLAILIDEDSASASEILSGAIQDWDRGVIVGRRSFGKGLVQQEFSLQDGSRLRVTIARYHTPSGRVVQSPYEMGKSDKYYENYVKRYLSAERFNADSIKIADSLMFKTLKKGRPVYGGGGIVPDIFMPVDTSYYSKEYIKSINLGIMTDFVAIYSDNHRKEFEKRYGVKEEAAYKRFVEEFEVSKEYFEEFLEYSKEHKVEFSEEALEKSGAEIRRNLKGLIIRNLYGLDMYIRYINSFDKEVQKALEVVAC